MGVKDGLDTYVPACDTCIASLVRRPFRLTGVDKMLDNLPQSVRYVKNGEAGKWWGAAKARGQLHCGWWFVPRDLLQNLDLSRIKPCIQEHYPSPSAATADFNVFQLVTQEPSQYTWVTFEEDDLWWCTVRDGITVNQDESKKEREGSFWLTCNRPWSNYSIGGRRLAKSNLQESVVAVANFHGVICEPKGSRDILRVIQGNQNTPSE
jgi:hypothetical protein